MKSLEERQAARKARMHMDKEDRDLSTAAIADQLAAAAAA